MHARNELQGYQIHGSIGCLKCYRRIFIAKPERYDHVVFAKFTIGYICCIYRFTAYKNESILRLALRRKKRTPQVLPPHIAV